MTTTPETESSAQPEEVDPPEPEEDPPRATGHPRRRDPFPRRPPTPPPGSQRRADMYGAFTGMSFGLVVLAALLAI